jgi:L-malate glycosyltransferase
VPYDGGNTVVSSAPLSLQLAGSKELGGAERWLMRFAAALDERGIPAEIGVRHGSGLAAHDFGRLPLHRLPFLTVWDPVSSGAVSSLIRRRQPEIVQTYMGRATRLTRLPRGNGPVHVARLGGYYALSPYRHAHAWIGNTRGLCDWMVAQGLPAERVFQIYNFAAPPRPVDPTQVSARRVELGIPDDAWVLVALGRLVPVKGHADLIAALARIPDEIAGRPLRLVLVGDGPLGDSLRHESVRLGQSGRICWAGWQTDPGLYLQMADLVVFPSLENETLGNVILEAWSWSRPLLATRFRGARELASHGENAWCVPCTDPPALAEGIRTLLADDRLRASLVASGRRRIATDLSRDAVMDRYLELYRLLVRS